MLQEWRDGRSGSSSASSCVWRQWRWLFRSQLRRWQFDLKTFVWECHRMASLLLHLLLLAEVALPPQAPAAASRLSGGCFPLLEGKRRRRRRTATSLWWWCLLLLFLFLASEEELRHRLCKQRSRSCKSLVDCGRKYHKRCRVLLQDVVVVFGSGTPLSRCWWYKSALANNRATSECPASGSHRDTHIAWSVEDNGIDANAHNAGILLHCSLHKTHFSRFSSMPRASCMVRRISHLTAPLTMLVFAAAAALTNRTPPWLGRYPAKQQRKTKPKPKPTRLQNQNKSSTAERRLHSENTHNLSRVSSL